MGGRKRSGVEKVPQRLEGTSEHTHQAMDFLRKTAMQRYLIRQSWFEMISSKGYLCVICRKAQDF